MISKQLVWVPHFENHWARVRKGWAGLYWDVPTVVKPKAEVSVWARQRKHGEAKDNHQPACWWREAEGDGAEAPGLHFPGRPALARARPLEAARGGAGSIPGTFRGASVSAGAAAAAGCGVTAGAERGPVSRRRAGRWLLCSWSFRVERTQRCPGVRAQGAEDCSSEREEALQPSPRWPSSPTVRQVSPPVPDGGPALRCPCSPGAARPVPQVAAAGGRPLPSGPGRVGAGAQDRGPGDPRRLRPWSRPPALAAVEQVRGHPRSFPRPPWGCPGGAVQYRRPILAILGIRRAPAFFLPWAAPGRARAARLLVSWRCHSALHLVSPGGPFGWLGVAPRCGPCQECNRINLLPKCL